MTKDRDQDSIKTPEDQLSSDPGGDIQSRFLYQGICAAIYSLALLDTKNEIESLYCEHYEDILIKGVDGRYNGVQVKTRETRLGPFTANDDEIVTSLCRFVEIEKEFPDLFIHYTITSNCGFWEKQKNKSNLNYIIKVIKACKNYKEAIRNQHCTKFLQKIKNSTINDTDLVFQTLKKVRTDKKPDMSSILSYLMVTLASIFDIEHRRFYIIKELANTLINKMIMAASLTYKGKREGFYMLLRDPDLEKTNDIIKGKKITKAEIISIFDAVVSKDTVWDISSKVLPKEESDGLTMESKLELGRISEPNIEFMKIAKSVAEAYFVKWHYKYKKEDARNRYNQILFIVYNECITIYDSLRNDNNPFGQEMLNRIRKRLQERFLNNKDAVFGCELEILQGVVGMLTDQCHIWWSKKKSKE